MQKARRQGTSPLRLLVSVRFQVLFHSPSRSTFHLSLTGTGSLSVTREYLALEGGPPRFPQGFPCPVVLGNTNQRVDCYFAYRTITFYGRTFQADSAITSIFNSPASLRSCPKVPHNPACTTRAGFNIQAVWAVPRSLAATWGIAVAFSSRSYLDGSVRFVCLHQAMCSPGDDAA
jgi:hypothetical protein